LKKCEKMYANMTRPVPIRTWRTPIPRSHVVNLVCALAPTSPIPGVSTVTLNRHEWKTKTMGATSKIAHTDNTERSGAIAMRQVRPVFSSVQIDKKVPSRAIRVPEERPRTHEIATQRLLPVNWSA
jgi:hypothetical protein